MHARHVFLAHVQKQVKLILSLSHEISCLLTEHQLIYYELIKCYEESNSLHDLLTLQYVMYFHLQGKLKLTNDDHESHLSVDIEWIHYTYKGMVLLWLFIFVFWHYNWIQFRKVSFFWWKQSNKFIENGPLLLQTMAQFNKWLYFSRFFYNLFALIEI